MNFILRFAFIGLGLFATSGFSFAAKPDGIALVDAVEQKQWRLAEALASDETVGAIHPDKMTALHWAVFHDNETFVARLIELGASVDGVTHYGLTPLLIACHNGSNKTAALLLNAGCDANLPGPGKVTPLMHAARSGNAVLTASLIQSGASVNAKQRSGQTALMWAASEGHTGVIQELVAAGADLESTLPSGFSALMFASRSGHIDAARKLIVLGADLSGTMDPKQTSGRNPRKGMSALMLAVESAHYELALSLVEAGADPNDERSEYAPLHALAWVRRPQKGDNPEGDPPPRGSGSVSSLQFVEQIVGLGADVNFQLRRGKAGKGRLNSRGATPFLMAAQTVDLPLMKVLLDLGADPKLTNHDETTAVLAACGVGNHHVGEHPGSVAEVEQTVRFLVDLGLDINVVDNNGETAMHGAAYRCYPETIDLVASLGADPNIWDTKNRHGWTPLIIAHGYRPGSFKPDPPTITAVKRHMTREIDDSDTRPSKKTKRY